MREINLAPLRGGEMTDEKLAFTLTGSFQYDLGILGLKKVLDFFDFEYESDDYQITINKEDWNKIGKCAYFYGYYFNGIEKLKRKYNIKKEIEIKQFEDVIKSAKDNTFEDVEKKLIKISGISDNKQTEFFSYPALSVFNISHLNVFNPGCLKQAKKQKNPSFFYEMFMKKFEHLNLNSSSLLARNRCDFCQKYNGEPLNRNNFLFASSAMNQGWYEKPNIHICSYCSALNLFSIFTPITMENGERYLIYSSNLKELEIDNNVISDSFENLMYKFIEEQEKIKVETNRKDKLFIKMNFDSQNPDVDFLPFTAEIIKKFVDQKNILAQLKETNFIGIAKKPIINAYKDTIRSIINNEDLISKVDFITNLIIKQKSGNKNLKGFDDRAIEATLIMLKISILLKGGCMENNYLKDFTEFGENLRKRLYAGKSFNAAKNKAISFVSALRDAVNQSKEKFMETVLQLSIYFQLPIPSALIQKINQPDFNYKEAGLAIALTLMSSKE